MRPIHLLLGLVLFAGALTGCGAGGGDDTASGSGEFPVSIPNQYGKTVVKKQPKRVVTIGFKEHDTLLGLGIEPVALKQFHPQFANGVGPWASKRLGDAKPKVFPASSTEINIGQIAKLKPDLIVGVDAAVSKAQYDTLSDLAPTLVRPKQYQDFTVPYEKQAEMIGKAVGKEKQARRLVADAGKSLSDAKKAHPSFEGKTAAVVMPDPQTGGLWVYSRADARGQFVRKLGFTIPQRIEDATGGKFAVRLGPERLDLVGDVDLLIVVRSTPTVPDSKLFADLPVAKEKHVLWPNLDDSLAITYNTVLSIPYTVDRYAPRMEKTVDAGQ